MVVKNRNSKDGRPYRVVELFSGIGAQHMALERAGIPYEIVGICDIDPNAVTAYEAIHGPAPMLGETKDKQGRRIGDVTRIQHLPKDVDILTYSFPCTDLSQANRMGKGLKGEHSGLIWAVGDILEQAEKDGRLPRYLIMENVPQVFSAKNRKDWDAWMRFLSTLGYTSQSGTLNAKDFSGTGQNRNRAFMVSHLGPDCPLLPTPPGGDTVMGDVLEDCVDSKYYLTKNRVKGLKESTEKEKARGNSFQFKPLDPRKDVAHAITTKEGARKTSNYVRNTGSCHQVGTLDGMKGYEEIRRVYGKDGVSPTITAKKGGGARGQGPHGEVRREKDHAQGGVAFPVLRQEEEGRQLGRLRFREGQGRRDVRHLALPAGWQLHQRQCVRGHCQGNRRFRLRKGEEGADLHGRVPREGDCIREPQEGRCWKRRRWLRGRDRLRGQLTEQAQEPR